MMMTHTASILIGNQQIHIYLQLYIQYSGEKLGQVYGALTEYVINL